MCKRIQNNYLCDHFTTTDIPGQIPCNLDFMGNHAFTWEQASIPYPCNTCISRFDDAYSTIKAYNTGLNDAVNPILRDLATCDAIHSGHPNGIYTRQELRALSRAFNRCIDKLFAVGQIAEGFKELYDLRAQLISDMRHGIEAEESWDALDTLKGLDNAIEARIKQTENWNFNFSSVIKKFAGPFRFTKLVERALEHAPEAVEERYAAICAAFETVEDALH